MCIVNMQWLYKFKGLELHLGCITQLFPLQSTTIHSINLYCVPTVSHSLSEALGMEGFKTTK